MTTIRKAHCLSHAVVTPQMIAGMRMRSTRVRVRVRIHLDGVHMHLYQRMLMRVRMLLRSQLMQRHVNIASLVTCLVTASHGGLSSPMVSTAALVK